MSFDRSGAKWRKKLLLAFGRAFDCACVKSSSWTMSAVEWEGPLYSLCFCCCSRTRLRIRLSALSYCQVNPSHPLPSCLKMTRQQGHGALVYTPCAKNVPFSSGKTALNLNSGTGQESPIKYLTSSLQLAPHLLRVNGTPATKPTLHNWLMVFIETGLLAVVLPHYPSAGVSAHADSITLGNAGDRLPSPSRKPRGNASRKK